MVEDAGVGVGAGSQHRVHRVDAAERRVLALRALRPVLVEVERERDDLALAHQARRGDDVLGLRVVERADLVVRPPSSPVLEFLGGGAQVLAGKLTGSHGAELYKGETASVSGARAWRGARRRLVPGF